MAAVGLGTHGTDRTSADAAGHRSDDGSAAGLLPAWRWVACCVSLPERAARLGMHPQPLAWYFPSKNALYDAMHAQGDEEFLQRLGTAGPPLDVHRAARVFAEFCLENPPRYQLLAQRTVPGSTPSAESAELARRAFAAWRSALAEAGVTDREAVDVLTAVVEGVVDQQITVDPGGDRFLRHLDLVINMFLAHTGRERS